MPCYVEGGWENTHSDGAHDVLTVLGAKVNEFTRDRTGAKVFVTGAVELRKLAPKAGIKNAAKHKSAELRGMILDAIRLEQDGCWICHPELNEALKVAKTRTATTGERISRKGQKINVPLRAPGELKAHVVLRAANVGEKRAKLQILGLGAAILDIDLGHATLHLAWDAEGRYDYAEARFTKNGKSSKVRNVAEALRLIYSK